MPSHLPLDPSILTHEAEALGRLARRLLADPDRAADAAQETLRVALEQGPRPGFEPRAWLRGVLRNVVRRQRRGEFRRRARERAVAVADLAPAQASAERLARRRAVLEAVLVLPEVLRTTIEWRFFEALPPRRIARRMGIPVETVRSRVRRGLTLLRAELDRREGGDGRRWALALAPLAHPGLGRPVVAPPRAAGGPAWNVLTLGGVLMTTKGKVALVAGLVLVLAAGLWRIGAESPREELPIARAPRLAEGDPSGAPLAAAPGGTPAATGEVVPIARPRLEVTGLVTDAEGVPLPGARLHATDADRLEDRARSPDATTDGSGRFALVREGSWTAWRVSASLPGRRAAFVTALAGAPREVVLRLGRTTPLWILVLDESMGAPIPGAEVSLIRADEGGSSLETATTDEEGRARVEDPGVRPMAFESVTQLRVSAAGHESVTLSLDGRFVPGATTRARPHRVVLRAGVELAVRVLDREGRPVEDAVVRGWCGGDTAGYVSGGTSLRRVPGLVTRLGPARTDAQGGATLGTPLERWYVYAARGADVAFATGSATARHPVRLTLAPGITIVGVARSEAGMPLEGVRVGVDWFSWFVIDPSRDRVPTVPAALASEFTVATGPEGRFSLPGVPRRPDARAFALEAREGDLLGSAPVEVGPDATHASADIVLRRSVPGGDVLSLYVRTAEGAPIAGALLAVPFLEPGARTDATGRGRLATHAATVAVRGVRVSAPGFASVVLPGPALDLHETTEVVLGPEAVLDLVVRGPDREPVPGAQVVVLEEGTEAEVLAAFEDRASPRRLAERHTDVDGRVRVDGLPRGPVRVSAEYFDPQAAPGATSRRNRAVLALPVPGPAELLLPAVASSARGQVVEGEILDEEGARVRGMSTAALQSAELGQNRSGSVTGGRFHFDDVPAGRWQLQVYAEGDSTPRTAIVEVREGLDVLGLRIAPTAPGRLRGRVIAEGVADLSGLPVQAIDTQGLRHVRARGTTDAAGEFLLDRLPAGRYVLELRAPAGARVPLRVLEATPIDLAAGQDLRHDLNATPAARVVLRCEDARVGVRPEGAPTLDAMRTPEATTNLVLEGPQGAYPVEFGLYRGRNELPWALGPGRHRVRIRRFDGLEATREFDVRGPGELELEFEFPTPPK